VITGILICLFLLFAIAVVIGVAKQRYIEKLRGRVRGTYQLDELYISNVGYGLLGLSFAEKKVLLGNHVEQRLFDWSQIASVEIIKDGVVVTETNRRSQLRSAAVGELAFGPVGALIGGMSGSTVSKNRITELGLKLIVDSRVKPVFAVTFFRNRTKSGSDPNALLVKKAQGDLERMHGHLVNAIRQSSQER
jgi:hypothetical protein